MATGEADAEGTAHVEGPLLAEGVLERRRYQLRLADTAAGAHTLVCLPTGLGKTTVSLLVTARRLEAVGGRALLLAPTKPLVRQHADFYREALSVPDDDVVVFTGEVSPDDRADLWDDARVVVATPQVVENDLVGGRVSLASVTHVTFDECHRATGDYAYNYIAERYHRDANRPLVTGMSASPGGDEAAILRVCENLGVETVEVMTEEDADVAEYTHDTDVEWKTVELPDPVMEIRDALNDVVRDRLTRLKELGVCSTTQPDLSQKQLNEVRGRLQELIDNGDSDGFEGMSVHAEVMKLRQAVTLVETQSVEALRRYFERQREAARSSGASKADQRLVSDPSVREAMRRAEAYDALHPKYSRTRRLTAETLGIENGDRVIVFTESRDTAEALTEFLGEHFAVRRFVGQGDRQGSDGMTQRQQQDTLESFRQGEFEVLVSTSVAEEGLDVPEVDLVLFYEPVPTAIRSVQRKGRTGRQTEGRVVVLMAEDTRDEAYFWISRRREKEMEEELRALKEVADEVDAELAQSDLDSFADEDATTTATTNANADASGEPESDAPDASRAELTDFAATAADDDENDEEPAGTVASAGANGDGHGAETAEVVVDQRELESSIARDLSLREGVETRLETLAVGDYVLSDRVVVERKSVADFVDTLVGGDRSMFEQVGDMARHYARPVVLLEGEGLYSERDVHPNAIRGALASLAVDFDASVLRTADEDGTADMLATVAEREQTVADREVSVHGEKQSRTLDEQQEYVVSSIADVGPVTARALLAHFGTVEAVMTAREDDLLEVDGVGEVTAARLREVVGSEYDPS
ncbi:Hef nuclease [Halobacteriales archaeon SW_12_71_31]|nr:MAG: Hef nuclease [Halobacteriales archaeon SW_12_71_31]